MYILQKKQFQSVERMTLREETLEYIQGMSLYFVNKDHHELLAYSIHLGSALRVAATVFGQFKP